MQKRLTPLVLDSAIVSGMVDIDKQKRDRERETWIDDVVYQQIKYRERFFEPPKGPFS